MAEGWAAAAVTGAAGSVAGVRRAGEAVLTARVKAKPRVASRLRDVSRTCHGHVTDMSRTSRTRVRRPLVLPLPSAERAGMLKHSRHVGGA